MNIFKGFVTKGKYILHITDDAHHAKTHQQRKDYGSDEAGILGYPKQDATLDAESEEGDVGRQGKNKCHSNGTADNAHNEGGNHRQLIATEGSLLMLADILHGIQTTGKLCHKFSLIVKRWLLREEQFLKFFIFFHNLFNYQLSIINCQLFSELVASS